MSIQGYAMSDKDPSDIPKPQVDFHGRLTDIDNIVTEGAQIAFNGHTFISAKRGATSVYIPFEKIDRLEIRDNEAGITSEQNEIPGNLILTDGTEYELEFQSKDEVTGTASFGQFRIRIDHIRSLKLTSKPDATRIN